MERNQLTASTGSTGPTSGPPWTLMVTVKGGSPGRVTVAGGSSEIAPGSGALMRYTKLKPT